MRRAILHTVDYVTDETEDGGRRWGTHRLECSHSAGRCAMAVFAFPIPSSISPRISLFGNRLSARFFSRLSSSQDRESRARRPVRALLPRRSLLRQKPRRLGQNGAGRVWVPAAAAAKGVAARAHSLGSEPRPNPLSEGCPQARLWVLPPDAARARDQRPPPRSHHHLPSTSSCLDPPVSRISRPAGTWPMGTSSARS